MRKGALLIVILAAVYTFQAVAQDSTAYIGYEPNILMVTAHPDDDAIFSATIFKTTKLLGGNADLAVITNGEGGYKYSTLGNYIYGKELDKEEVGREYLPGIRKKELMNGGEIVGIRNYFFLDQEDFYYTLDAEETFQKWDTTVVIERLYNIMRDGNYDFLFLLLPFPEFHGHHKASTVLALEAMMKLEPEKRPIALYAFVRRGQDDPGISFLEMPGYPSTKVMEGKIFEFDRNQTFGFDDRLNYNIISNWVIAEHKSQGTMQLLMQSESGIIEQYWFLEVNGDESINKTAAFFDAINKAQPD